MDIPDLRTPMASSSPARRASGRASETAPSYVLVLTASVSPSAGAKVQRSDPAQRRQDYLNALNFWLQSSDPRLNRIIFVENSGDDFKPFRSLAETSNPYRKRVEFISTPPVEIPDGIQYGMGELCMIDDGLAQSQLLAEATHFIKVTGRLTFPSLPLLLDRLPANFDAVTECRIPTRVFCKGLSLIPALIERREAYTSTQLIIFRTAFYDEYFRGLHRTMVAWTRHGVIEGLLYDRLREVASDSRVLWRFPVNCEPVGVGARSNVNYQSTQRRIMSVVRGLLRGTDIWI